MNFPNYHVIWVKIVNQFNCNLYTELLFGIIVIMILGYQSLLSTTIKSSKHESYIRERKKPIFGIVENSKRLPYSGKRLKVDVNQSSVSCSGKTMKLEIEDEIEGFKFWTPDENRSVEATNEMLKDDKTVPDYKRVKHAFNLTLPQQSIVKIFKFHEDRAGYMMASAKLRFNNTKLLWSWNYRIEKEHIKLNPETATDTPSYGSGYYLASDAAVAQYFSSQKNPANNSLVLSQVNLGKTYYYTDNNPKAYYSLPPNNYHTLAVRIKVKLGPKDIEGWIYVVPEEIRILPSYLITFTNK